MKYIKAMKWNLAGPDQDRLVPRPRGPSRGPWITVRDLDLLTVNGPETMGDVISV